MSPFESQIKRFLDHQRALGFSYRREEAFLKEFGNFTSCWPEAILSEALVRQYLSSWGEAGRPHRLTVLRSLARFLVIEESRTFVPPMRFLGIRQHRPPVRVFSREEACRFLAACDVLPDVRAFPLGLVHGIALRTLLLTGLRRGELLALHEEDVDLTQEILTIRCGKFGKSRFVPLTSDLAQRLRVYREAVAVHIARRQPGSAFFPRPAGHQPTALSSLYESFRQVLELAGIPHHGRGRGPRLHDLRHSFAVLRLLSWYETGANLRAKLPLLATYLGHIGLASSQVYLHMTEDFIGELTRRQLDHFGDLITEVPR